MPKPIQNSPIQIARVFAVVLTLNLFSGAEVYARGGGELPLTTTSENGYVFVDGDYIAAPYNIESTGQQLRINGTEFDASAFDQLEFPREARGGGGRGDGRRGPARGAQQGRRGGRRGAGGRPAGHNPGGGVPGGGMPGNFLRRMHSELDVLQNGAVVLFVSGQNPRIFFADQRGHDLLEAIVRKAEGETVEIPDSAGDEADRAAWQQVVMNFRPTSEFLQRATTQVDALNKSRSETESEFAAKKLSRQISYPMTMFALVLVVFAVGHLMTIAQPTFSDTFDADAGEKTTAFAKRSLAIIALLSVIDLVWTILAHQSGSMRELNPIGGKMISDPFQLLVFKVTLTSIAIVLLFRLRQLPLTRKATWWCCLVLTLLTVRWLTFQSMFA